ncbi:sacsin N-terminal ATP-binding-like domain-containing protein [Pseudonocardia sediminis]|uniref:sacsin N-terminal ATP-binding-like domain-containing protein n=1 Tax=Pseudonocardia sediminis TaxID=1397368 RepID=UPI00102A9264|nr:ATP-binding protein [Pseudonocardia sediminis]
MRRTLRRGGRHRLAGARLRAGLRRRRGPGTRELLIASSDPFGTTGLRTAVLDAWASSPTRFREDANAEEDLRLGGYADTWCVELVQNAADAGHAAGGPGRVRFTVAGDELRVANTGAPLDAAGVTALASLRASAKRDDDGATGRFGVGFAAVLALTDEPRLVTTGADGDAVGVRFSASATAEEVAALPGPAAEAQRRDGRVPVLRLAWPLDAGEDPVPSGFTSEVRLPLRDPSAASALLDEVRAIAPDLLLALPGLGAIEVGDDVVERSEEPGGLVRVGPRRWRLVRRSADVRSTAAAAEERDGAGAVVVWAVPVDDDGHPRPLTADRTQVLHAPTASAERLSLPARLIAPFPLDPDRRRIRDGARTDALVAAAGRAYADLVTALDPADRTALVPEPAFPRSVLDGRLRESVGDALDGADWLPGAGGTDLVPRRAEWLDVPGTDGLPELLAGADPSFARLVATGPPPPSGLDLDRVPPPELVDRLLSVEASPDWWRRVYAALAPALDAVPGLADDLRALPVPLADGRVVRGPGSVLLPDEGGDDAVTAIAALGISGLHVAAPEAVHPLLRRLGAGDADRAALRAHPALREAVARSLDDADAGLDVEPLARAVLALLEGAGRESWAGALALTDDDGVPARADELVLPDAAIAPVLDPDAPVGVLAQEWTDAGRDALVAAGVLDSFAVVTAPDGGDLDLHDADAWLDEHEPGTEPVVAVRDLDLVADDAWPAALALLAGDRDTRAAVLVPGGYTAWWLARHARIGGHPASHWRTASATGLAGLYDPVPVGNGDEAVLAAAGVRDRLHVDGPGDAADLLDRLGDDRREAGPGLVVAAHAVLAEALTAERVDVADLDPPDRVRALTGAVVAAEGAVVLDAPWAAPALEGRGLVTGGDPDVLAELLDLPLASETVRGKPSEPAAGTPVRWAEVTEVVVACHTLGVGVPDGELVRHDELRVDLTAPEQRRITVAAWPGADGRWHASDPLRALVGALSTTSRARKWT